MVILALWLPGTFHCSLEAAGLVPSECCSAGEDTDADHSPPDSPSHPCEPCSVVEQCGGTQVAPARDITPAPVWVILVLPDAALSRPEPVPCRSLQRTAPPGDWSTRWRFTLRTAASPRSPSRLPA
ncbi:MAG: hypothetical protein JNL10_22785 [Verrucomicrobiales bacterium]|nr:hypothetical protein [Verrucomicrobiales bacterium]